MSVLVQLQLGVIGGTRRGLRAGGARECWYGQEYGYGNGEHCIIFCAHWTWVCVHAQHVVDAGWLCARTCMQRPPVAVARIAGLTVRSKVTLR